MKKIIVLQGVNEDRFFVRANEIIYNLENNIKLNFSEMEGIELFFDNCKGKMDNVSEIIGFEKRYKKISEHFFTENLLNEFEIGDTFIYYLRITNKNKDGDFDVIPLRYFSILRRKYKDKIFLGIEETHLSNLQRISAYMLIDNLTEMNFWKSKWVLNTQKGKEEYYLRVSIQKDFLKVMISSLSKLGACYLVRAESMNRIFIYASSIGFELNEFELFYGASIKRLITLSKDETIGLWLEYLLLEGREYGNKNFHKLEIGEDFRDLLFYENTYIITDATEELYYKEVNSKEDIQNYIQEYYFDNFRKLMDIDYLHNSLMLVENKDEQWNNTIEILMEMVNLRKHLLSESTSVNNYYLQLLSHIKKITNANYVCIYGIDVLEQVYIIGSTIDNFYNTDFFLEINNARKNNTKKAEYLKDSVFFYSETQVILCLTEKSIGDKSNGTTDVVWLMMEFQQNNIGNADRCIRDIKYAIRNILVHRYLLWERLKDDFRKDSFNRIKKLSIKNELLSKSKAGSHTPDVVLKRIERNLKNLGTADECILTWAGTLLQLATDSLISKLYVESIREQDSEEKQKEIVLSFEYFRFTEEIQSLFNRLSYVNKDKSENDPTHAEIVVEDYDKEICFYCPDEKRFYDLYIIAAIIQNAVKHGKAGEDNKVRVYIKFEEQYLVIENALKDGYQNKLRNDKYAVGITIEALKYYFHKYYGMDMQVKIVEIDNTYRVKIPVIAKFKDKGENTNGSKNIVYR